MIVEKGHFHFAEKYWGGGGEGGKAPLVPPVPTALFSKNIWENEDVEYKKIFRIRK